MRFLTVLLLSLSLALGATADSLRVRHVVAAPEGEVSPGAEDLGALLERNLGLAGCELVETKTSPLSGKGGSANAKFSLAAGYELVVRGERAKGYSLVVRKDGKELLRTTFRIGAENHPVLVGGFRAGDAPEDAKKKRLFAFDIVAD